MKLKTNLLLLIIFTLFSYNFTNAQCDGTSDIIQNSRNLELTTSTSINVGMGNSFTATCSGVIEGVSFWTYRVPGTIGQTSVTIQLYRNPFSSGRVLMSTYTTDISFQNEGSLERYFPFENSPTLVAGTVYGVRFINNESGQIIDLDLHTGNRLAGGNMFVDNFNQSSPWSTRDLRFQIHYEDNVAPIARCRNITRTLGVNGTVSISTSNVNNNSTDADSGTASFFISQNTFDCSNIGDNTVTLTVRDQNGNTDNCQAIVTIVDETAPVLTCPGNITVYTDPGVPIAVTYNDIGYNDCTVETPDGFTFLAARNGKTYFLSQNPISPSQAFLNAEALGGHLATIENQEDNDFIRAAVDGIINTNRVIIGYNDVSSEGNFVWHSGSTTSYTNWNLPNEPNNVGNEDYTEIRSDGKWNDTNNGPKYYIIELSQESIIQTEGFASGDFFPVGTTTNTFEATDAFGRTGTCSFDVTVIENPFETSVALSGGKLTITDIETDSDDQITLSNDGNTLTISNLILPTVSGGPTLVDTTTVTVQLADITNGIEFVGGNGDNTIAFTDNLTLTGINNNITLNDIRSYSQGGSITLEGDFTINGNSGGSVSLNTIIAKNLSITGVDRITDAGGTEMNISGTTNLQTFQNINLNSGFDFDNQFNGAITMQASNIVFRATSNLNLNGITTTGTASTIKNFFATGGNIMVSSPITTAGDSNLLLRTGNNIISQTVTGSITTNKLELEGNQDNNPQALLAIANNDIASLASNNIGHPIATIAFNDVNSIELQEITTNELLLTANTFTFSENTNISINGVGGISNFDGDINITTTDSLNPAVINHNAGTINFNGAVNNFDGALDYNGVNGVTSNFTGTTTLVTAGISPFFGNLNGTGVLTVDVFSNILNEARFSGSSTFLKGRASLVGAPVIIENDATITPGSIGDVTSLSLSDVSISSAIFAPVIEDDDDYDILGIQGSITLTNASFNPIIGTGTFGNFPIVLIDNDGTDPIIGTFNGYPEGSTIQFGDYTGIISYVGGDGNDMTISALETTVNLVGGKLTITDVNGGVSDDQITLSNDGTIVTISNLVAPVLVSGGPILTDTTTITIPLSNITNGIEFASENGTDAITIANDLTLTGANNGLKFNTINNFTQSGFIDIEGTLEITGDTNITINLGQTTAGNLIIHEVASVIDAGGKITIAGTTNFTTSGEIDINDGEGNHEFNGPVTLEANRITMTTGNNISFDEVTITANESLLNYLIASPGTVTLNGNVAITDRNTNLFIGSNDGIFQQSGFINDGFLILLGNGSGDAILNLANTAAAIAAENPFSSTASAFANLSYTNTVNMFLADIIVDEFTLTAPQFDVEPGFTNITKNGSGISNFNGDFDVNTGSGTAIINHNAGTINFNGQVNDFKSQFTYNGVAGTITNINGGDTDFPQGGPNRGFTFGFLNVTGDVHIGDVQVNILNTATFTGLNTLMTGFPFISGGNTIIENSATITPGNGTGSLTYNLSNLAMNSGAIFAPLVEGIGAFDRDQLNVTGTVTLNDVVLTPTGGFIIQAGEEVVIINNDGTDAIIGTFNGLPEGAGVAFGDFIGMISYVGGDGNDVVLVPDTIDPTAICQDVTFEIGLDGITVNAAQIDNGSSDNAGIASILINGETQVNFTYEDLGDNAVTMIVTDTSGNTAECTATVTLTSNVTFPILISEYQPQITGFPVNQNIEIKGEPGEVFLGVFVVIENDADTGNEGLVLSADTISGTFNSEGLLVASIPNIAGPSHTVVLTTSFSGTAGVTNVSSGGVEERSSHTVDLSTFGVILDAVGVGDGGACCPVDNTIGVAFGGVDVPSIGAIPSEIFRNASTGDFFQISPSGVIYDTIGNSIDASLFDTVPTNDGTFGQINPTISINMNANAFITTWKTDNSGSSADNQITIFTDASETYNYFIDWGDGTSDTNVTGNITHTYDTAGTYTIGILGTFPRFISNGRFSGDALKLLSIDQWGNIAWNSFDTAFHECRNMNITATDIPDLSNVTTLYRMFDDCQTLVGNATMNNWNVSNVQNMQLMFSSALNFNQPLDNWNVSNVTNMSSMFNTAEKFNQNLNSWNTSQVQFMDFMFLGALDFNGQIGNWNVANVTEMSWMFNNAEDFNQDLNNWNTGQVQEMDFMFLGATAFNGNITTWNTAQVTTMSTMFQNAVNFNQDISGWNVANVTDMSYMFKDATNFNQNIGNWNVSNVTIADEILIGTAFSNENYDLLLVNWNQLTLQNNVNFATDASYCIGETAKQNIITNHTWNFTDAGLNCDAFFITKWETTTANESITIPTFSSETYNYTVDWGDGTVETGFTENATHTYTSAGMYTVSISGDFPRIHFNNGGDRLKLLEVVQWGTNPWTSMASAFQGCRKLIVTATDAPDLSNATSINGMFRDAAKDVDVTLWQDISHWDVSTIIDMQQVFRGMDFNQNISFWNVSSTTNMGAMFRGNKKFNQDISSWDVSNVTNMSNMFYLASDFNQDISSWDVSNVQSMNIMLRATDFNHDLSAWDISSVTNMSNIFTGSEMSVENYDNTIIGWATLDTTSGETQIPTNIPLGATNIHYCEAEFKRLELIDSYGWTITDAGKDADCSNSFITTWQTAADNESITIPTTGSGYNYLVDWGDGTVEIGFTGDATHTYATAGTYTVSITGDFPRIYFNYDDVGSKIQEVQQWGTIAWTSMERAFAGCENLNITASDAPDLSNVTSTSRMFIGCSNLLGNATFNTWDVSNIEDMTYMFSSASNFNTDLNNWNVSNVTNMQNMFSNATNFNGNISTWNTGEVIDMTGMFFFATAFEGIGGLNSWNVSKVEDMGSMFRHAEAFNQDLNNWNVSNVTYMNSIFWGAIAFNGNISNWDITGITSLDYMFYNAAAFNGDLSLWDVTNIESLDSTFYGATSFNTELNTWNVSNVTTMQSLFDGASSFNKPLDNWDVSNVSFMYRMFYNATNFNQDVSNWNVSLNQSFSEMFLNTSMSVENYDRLLISWANLTLINNLQFGISSEYCLGAEAKQYIIDTFNWSFTDDGLDSNCTARFITTWETTSANETITIPTFSGETYNYAINWGDGTIESGLNGDATHTYASAGIHTVLITGTFPRIYFNNGGDKLKILAVQQWGTNIWTSMEHAFSGCENLEITATDAPNLSNVTNMTSMFEGAVLLNNDVSNWDVSNVNMMNRMFYGATSFDQYLGDWNISNITTMEDMLTNAMLSTTNYDNTLIAWATLATGETQIPSGVTFSGGDSMFCTSDYERQTLISSYNWTITDDGKTPDCTNRRFITTWQTTTSSETVTIPTTGSGYNYLVDWGDGTVDLDITGNATHTYTTAGTYTVSITGDFPRIYFNTNHNSQIQSIDQWGSNPWDSMFRAFSTCSNLDVLATDVPNLSNVSHMGRMFFSCPSLVGNEHFNDWDVSNVNNFGSTFQGASSFNQPLNNWDVSSSIKFSSMFSGATSFDQSLADWDISSVLNSGVANAANMFDGVTLSTENYDATLIGWATLDSGETRIPTPITFSGGNSQYCASETLRQELIDTYGWIITDGGLNANCDDVVLEAKVYLQGAAILPNTGEETLMRDDLRAGAMIPTTSPYADAITCSAAVFNSSGSDAIVDWVWIELRDENDNTAIIASQSALLQRDGDIVGADGTSALFFDVATGNYYITIKHRNHLGIMSANTIALSTVTTSVDFTNGSIATFGSHAQTSFGMPSGVLAMWTGNVNDDTIVQYSGTNPDTPEILSVVLNDAGNFLNFPTYTVNGYNKHDINMDGSTQYSGTNPDAPFILQNVIAHPGNFLNFSTYQITEQLPEHNE